MLNIEQQKTVVNDWGPDVAGAWERMGRQLCPACHRPMQPCPKGPGADELGFYPCPCGMVDYPFPRPRADWRV